MENRQARPLKPILRSHPTPESHKSQSVSFSSTSECRLTGTGRLRRRNVYSKSSPNSVRPECHHILISTKEDGETRCSSTLTDDDHVPPLNPCAGSRAEDFAIADRALQDALASEVHVAVEDMPWVEQIQPFRRGFYTGTVDKSMRPHGRGSWEWELSTLLGKPAPLGGLWYKGS